MATALPSGILKLGKSYQADPREIKRREGWNPRFDFGDLADLAKRMRANGPGSTPGGIGAGIILGGTYAGGTSVAANDALIEDTDNVLPPAGVAQDDYFDDGLTYDNPLLGDE